MSTSILEQAQLEALLKAFRDRNGAKYRLLSLGYFGSYARGEAGSESDVDIVFDTAEPNLFQASAMRMDLEELLGRPVDMLQLHGLTNVRMRARIEKEAIYV
jgi:uncharacterized protein